MSLAALIKATLEDGIVDVEEVVALKAEVYADGVVDLEEIVPVYEMARTAGVTDNSDGQLQALMRDMVIERYLRYDGEITDDEMGEITSIFGLVPANTTESERQILYVVRENADAICPAFDAFCAERNALEL